MGFGLKDITFRLKKFNHCKMKSWSLGFGALGRLTVHNIDPVSMIFNADAPAGIGIQ